MSTENLTTVQLLTGLDNMAKKLDVDSRQIDKVLKRFERPVVDDIESNFPAESSKNKVPDGNRWAELAESTQEAPVGKQRYRTTWRGGSGRSGARFGTKSKVKRRRRGPNNILHPRGKRGMMGTIQAVVKDGILYAGTNKVSAAGFPYPSVHQTGGKHTPRRTFLAVSSALVTRMQDALVDEVTDLKD
jgi:hypothetical protein